MVDYTDDISLIIQKYNKEEIILNERIEKIDQLENELEAYSEQKTNTKTKNEAMKRNVKLLEELQLTKAKLRSRAIFSPAEIQWDDICRRYQKAPSLVVTTWRCQFPAFD